jgi:bifunctional enzyme CysN/CysC
LQVRPGGTLWLTGLPGAGKTTLSTAAHRALVGQGRPTAVLDGDVLRRGISSDLGLSPGGRHEQARRAAHVATILSEAGVVAIVALVSPFAADRDRAREIHRELGLPFYEVWVDTPLEECERRDPKGLYSRARAGEITGMTGLDAPYERPAAPELRVVGVGEPPDAVAARIVALLPLEHSWAALSPARSVSA